MDQDRRLLLFRYAVKEQVREKGLSFTDNVRRKMMDEVKKMNTALKLDQPITLNELAQLYLEIMQELAQEHFALIKKHLINPQPEE